VPDNLKVVAHFQDGTVVHGTTLDFLPNRPMFHLQPMDGGPARKVQCVRLKALFFVKSFVGSPKRDDIRGFIAGPAETQQGRKVAVRFKDGELLCGYTLGYSGERDGFMMFPADAEGNNSRIYVMRSSTVEIKAGPAAEVLAEKVLAATEASGGAASAS